MTDNPSTDHATTSTSTPSQHSASPSGWPADTAHQNDSEKHSPPGADGVQVGSAFALSDESGIESSIKADIISRALAGTLSVRTDPRASPSGYPFKVVGLDDTVSDPETYGSRERVCDLGFLRTVYVGDGGAIGYRCPAEPVADFVAKGGTLDDTEGRKCLCNGLLATVGLGQLTADGSAELPMVTAGDDLERAVRALAVDGNGYSAADVVDYLLAATTTPG